MGFETLSYIYSMFPRKKLCFFNMRFEIYTYVLKKKSYVLSMWDLKSISIYTLCFQEKSYFFNVG